MQSAHYLHSHVHVFVYAATSTRRWAAARHLPATKRRRRRSGTSSSTGSCCRAATLPASRAGAYVLPNTELPNRKVFSELAADIALQRGEERWCSPADCEGLFRGRCVGFTLLVAAAAPQRHRSTGWATLENQHQCCSICLQSFLASDALMLEKQLRCFSSCVRILDSLGLPCPHPCRDWIATLDRAFGHCGAGTS